jgi:hypothetical protein
VGFFCVRLCACVSLCVRCVCVFVGRGGVGAGWGRGGVGWGTEDDALHAVHVIRQHILPRHSG